MDYDVCIHDEIRIVLCKIKERIDFASATSIAKDVRKRAHELDYGILYDVTCASVGVSTFEAYSFTRLPSPEAPALTGKFSESQILASRIF